MGSDRVACGLAPLTRRGSPWGGRRDGAVGARVPQRCSILTIPEICPAASVWFSSLAVDTY